MKLKSVISKEEAKLESVLNVPVSSALTLFLQSKEMAAIACTSKGNMRSIGNSHWYCRALKTEFSLSEEDIDAQMTALKEQGFSDGYSLLYKIHKIIPLEKLTQGEIAWHYKMYGEIPPTKLTQRQVTCMAFLLKVDERFLDQLHCDDDTFLQIMNDYGWVIRELLVKYHDSVISTLALNACDVRMASRMLRLRRIAVEYYKRDEDHAQKKVSNCRDDLDKMDNKIKNDVTDTQSMVGFLSGILYFFLSLVVVSLGLVNVILGISLIMVWSSFAGAATGYLAKFFKRTSNEDKEQRLKLENKLQEACDDKKRVDEKLLLAMRCLEYKFDEGSDSCQDLENYSSRVLLLQELGGFCQEVSNYWQNKKLKATAKIQSVHNSIVKAKAEINVGSVLCNIWIGILSGGGLAFFIALTMLAFVNPFVVGIVCLGVVGLGIVVGIVSPWVAVHYSVKEAKKEMTEAQQVLDEVGEQLLKTTNTINLLHRDEQVLQSKMKVLSPSREEDGRDEEEQVDSLNGDYEFRAAQV